MKNILILTLLLTACQAPLPPCEGTEEQIYRCESLRVQKEQLRRTKMMQIQQNQLIWDNFNKKYVDRPRYRY